ncbi:MAG: hypothetical protein O7F73_01605 [Gammaproteobacteria bacterium]|nr:hypothetical protein [Gammaproteobacteria bacterium]
MAIEDKVFSGDTLRVGYRFQRHGDNSMAYAFFCAELGTELYFVALLLDGMAGMIGVFEPIMSMNPFRASS